jgi:hypothetical protein
MTIQEKALRKFKKLNKTCRFCGKKISYKNRRNLFCNHSCAAFYMNNGIKGKWKPLPNCKICGDTVSSHSNIYCSRDCYIKGLKDKNIKEWLEGKKDGVNGKNHSMAHFIRNYLLKKVNYKCEECGWGEINIYTFNVPLEIHHKDGNYKNNKKSNLKVLCPNCHSLTKTHGSLNKNGRRINGDM